MRFNYEVSAYLTKISNAVISLSYLISCDQSADIKRKAIITMLELEQNTADFITDLNVPAEAAKICRENFLKANLTTIAHLEKIQLQGGYNFDELITALKLENETLIKEISFN